MLYPESLFGTHETVIMDPVHGGVPVFRHELAVLDHALLQRLRHLKQNDLTHLVFPGATQTRFHHSIGAMHVAGRCFQSLVNNIIVRRRQQTGPMPLSTEEATAVQYFYFTMRLAALLHDTGHGPFSHEFEKIRTVETMMREEAIFFGLWEGAPWEKYLQRPMQAYKHEFYSVRMALKVLTDTYASLTSDRDLFGAALPEVDDVLAIMEKTINPTTEVFSTHCFHFQKLFLKTSSNSAVPIAAQIKSILRSLLAGTLNCDTIDWLLRDSYYSGSKYGAFNADHLISSLRLHPVEDREGHIFKIELAIADKGLGALENFIYSRISLYKHVYSHKGIVAFKLTLNYAFGEVLADGYRRHQVLSALSDVDRFKHFHDEDVWALFKDVAATDTDSACAHLIARKKLIFLERRLADDDLDTALNDYRQQFRDSQILTKETSVRADPTEEGLYPIRILYESKHGPNRLANLPPSIDMLFQSFDQTNVHIFRTDAPWPKKVSHAKISQKGYIVAALGIPCCGKSTVMRYFAAKLGASYYREPEEWKWPDAVSYRDRSGYATAITWFRCIRVPNLYRAEEDARRNGEFAVVDSYYDKMLHLYLDSPAMEWLISKSDPYYASIAEIAALDYKQLPNIDLLICFKVSKDDWKRLRKIRGRDLDEDEKFGDSFGMQEVMLDAAARMRKELGIQYFVFERPFLEESGDRHPASIIADQLYDGMKHLLPSHVLPYT
ncbi:MAG TPA: HD domain-containing protein [Lacunisphaera sp.]|jgi:HD superfamily phosphohydrolase|nr:HD domain-containing protein [Lacunisphaera sp.]